MGTIADKLNYLNSTKVNLYSAINGKGGLIGKNTPFREYATHIRNIQTFSEFIDYESMKIDGALSFGDGVKRLPDIDCTGLTSLQSAFNNLWGLVEAPKLLNTSSITSMNTTFAECYSLVSIQEFDTSNVTTFSKTFQDCESLETLPLLDFGGANNISNMLSGCISLKNVGGFKDLGKGYTGKSANTTSCRLILTDCENLTKESVLNIFNNLYDLNLTYDVANGGTLASQSIVLGDLVTTLGLTESELAIATNKGWTIS